jgi:hypothetical protein
MSFSAILHEAPREEQARSLRHKTRLEGQASLGAGGNRPIVVHNISQTGAMFEAEGPLGDRDRVLLDIGGMGAIAASIVWSGGNLYACQCDQPIAESVIRDTVAREKVVWGRFDAPAADSQSAPRLVAAPSNPVSLTTSALFNHPAPEPTADERWPLPGRVAFIIGTALLCWAVPGTVLAWVLS